MPPILCTGLTSRLLIFGCLLLLLQYQDMAPHLYLFDSWSFIWGPGEFTLGKAGQRSWTLARNKRHTGDAPSSSPIVARCSLQRNWGTVG